MSEERMDSFKGLFKSLPREDAPEDLRAKIIEKIHEGKIHQEFWVWEPALVLTSMLIVSILGVLLALSSVPKAGTRTPGSPILQWAHVSPTTGFQSKTF